MRIPGRLPIGMTTKTAAGGVVATLGLAGAFLSIGARLTDGGSMVLHSIEVALVTFMLGTLLFTA